MEDILPCNETRVKVVRLLRCQATRRYFTGNGWSEDATHALLFPDEVDAVRAVEFRPRRHPAGSVGGVDHEQHRRYPTFLRLDLAPLR